MFAQTKGQVVDVDATWKRVTNLRAMENTTIMVHRCRLGRAFSKINQTREEEAKGARRQGGWEGLRSKAIAVIDGDAKGQYRFVAKNRRVSAEDSKASIH